MVVTKEERIEALVESGQELRVELERIIDIHHRTLTGSKLHDPEHIDSFRDCPCLTCQSVKPILDKWDFYHGA